MTTILTIEDEIPLLEEIVTLLEFENFTVLTATDGIQGLQIAREHLPDLILSDVMMPHLSGYEVLQELRNDTTTAGIPFIFLTARSEHSDIRRGMDIGADDYITKPFQKKELLTAIQSRLQRQQILETENLRQFAHHLVDVQERERYRIAQLMQNDIIQNLVGIKVTIEMGKQMPIETMSGTLDLLQTQLDKMLTQLRVISNDLWPTMLDHLGLMPLLSWSFNNFSKQTRVQVDFQHSELNETYSPEIKLLVLRILQESLNNVSRHAGVETVQVRIWQEGVNLVVQVLDEGRGFNIDEMLSSSSASGIIAMRERVLAYGGQFSIQSRPGEGTDLRIQCPVDRQIESHSGNAELATLYEKSGRTTQIFTDVQTQISLKNSETPKNYVSIILAHNHDLIRHGIRSILQTESQYRIVRETRDGRETVQQVESLKPDVLIVNLTMPGLSGLDVVRWIAQSTPKTKIVMISVQNEEPYVLEALHAGASAYVLKDASANELVQAVSEVHSGNIYLSSELPPTLYDDFAAGHVPNSVEMSGYTQLTNREKEILLMAVSGNTSTEIAKELMISPRTAETHRSNMMRKLGVHNQTELVRYAYEHGLISN